MPNDDLLTEVGDVKILNKHGYGYHETVLLPPTMVEVIASVWLVDEPPRPAIALVLVLFPDSPFFGIGEFNLDTDTLTIYRRHYNIVPAVEDYEQSGGDY